MSLIHKDGKIIANFSQPVKIFNTEVEYDDWVKKLENKDDDTKNFTIIKKYKFRDKGDSVECLINNKKYGWNYKQKPDYLTFTSDTEMNILPTFTNTGTIEYSIDDGITWTQIENNGSTQLSKKVCFRGNMETNTLYKEQNFQSSWATPLGTNIQITGDITTLLNSDGNVNQLEPFAFSGMFANNQAITSFPRLPSRILGEYCYFRMFYKCPKITKNSEEEIKSLLPARFLVEGCYQEMFADSGIEIAPDLLAYDLAKKCYSRMFKTCKNLLVAPKIYPVELAKERSFEEMFSYSGIVDIKPIAWPVCSSDYSFFRMFMNCISLIGERFIIPNQADYSCMEMFSGCTALTIAPELSTMTLSQYCYNSMFKNCLSLIVVSELPATTLAEYCYADMFSSCTSLTSAPSILPATILPEYCYSNMFRKCTSLITPPIMKNVYSGPRCCAEMFSECTSLVNTPDLLATNLDVFCYYSMFKSCISLTRVSELPATILKNYCYLDMFRGCETLQTPPLELPATILSDGCYNNMFYDCRFLLMIPNILATTLKDQCYAGMFNNTPKTLFSNIATEGYNQSITNNSTFKYILFSPLGEFSPNQTVYTRGRINSFTLSSDTILEVTPRWSNTGTMQYSTDNGINWYAIKSNSTITDAKRISFRGNMATNSLYWRTGPDPTSWGIFGTNIIASGDITTLLKPEGKINTLAEIAFSSVFKGCSALIIAPELPMTNLSHSCYSDMFMNCTSLTTTPELPATTLTHYSYAGMFMNCTSLTTISKIHATIIEANCYNGMFNGCSSLVNPPEINTDTALWGSYAGMFGGCTSLIRAPKLSALLATDACYTNMFYNCTSLTVAPELPATIISRDCYISMFNGCTSLISSPELPATSLPLNCYKHMFDKCSSLQSVGKISAAHLSERSYEAMFSNTPVDLFSETATLEHTYPITNNGAFPYEAFSPLGDLAINQTVYTKSPPLDSLISDGDITIISK